MKDSSTPLILVIDDEPTITQALSLHFRFRGYQVEVANSGRAGLERLSRGGVDVALCDINLGDITGHQVVQTACQALAEEAPEFVVMTANATLDHAIASLREGACQFVTKPWSVPYLETVVRRAVELRRLRRQVQVLEAAHQAYVLQTVEAATSNITLMAALESVLRALVVLHEPLRAAVWLLDPESGELRPVSLRLAEPGESLGPDHVAAAAAAFESGEVILRAAGDRLFSAAPIPVGQSIDGAVSMEQAGSAEMLSGSDFSAVLQALARHAGNAIEKDRLFASLEQSAVQISSLFEVGLAMSSEVSLQKLFDVIVDSAARICGAERCSLMLIEATGETLRIRAARGIDPQVVAEAVATVGQGISGTVAQSGQPLYVADIETDSRFARRNATQYSNTSLVCVPILVADRVVGVLNVNNKRSGANFDENDLNLMTLLASQAAVAIDNANRYEDMSERATRDGLTGVHSRGYFDDCLERAWRSAQSAGRTFSLVMLDLDHFKSVNDRYGHPAGDAVLREVARHLVIAVRDDDLVARYGGEEFSVILSRAEAVAALQVSERIRTAIEAMQVVHDGQVIQITGSIGVATFQEGCLSAAQLLNAADQALYQAKSSGRNRVILATPETG